MSKTIKTLEEFEKELKSFIDDKKKIDELNTKLKNAKSKNRFI